MSLYLPREGGPARSLVKQGARRFRFWTTKLRGLALVATRGDPSAGPGQVGSLAGAAHLLNDNTGVLR